MYTAIGIVSGRSGGRTRRLAPYDRYSRFCRFGAPTIGKGLCMALHRSAQASPQHIREDIWHTIGRDLGRRGGTLHSQSRDFLHFSVLQTRSFGTYKGADKSPLRYQYLYTSPASHDRRHPSDTRGFRLLAHTLRHIENPRNKPASNGRPTSLSASGQRAELASGRVWGRGSRSRGAGSTSRRGKAAAAQDF